VVANLAFPFFDLLRALPLLPSSPPCPPVATPHVASPTGRDFPIAVGPPPLLPLLVCRPSPTHRRFTAMKKLRIVILGFGDRDGY
jgi:hypothetical protein